MKRHNTQILIVVVAVWLVVQTSPLKGQSTTYSAPFAITGTSGSFQLGADGTLTLTGTGPFGSAAQFLWNPNLAAISYGSGCSASGYYSTASGSYTTASGAYGRASGAFSTASGRYATAFGFASTASGAYSTASIFFSTASGNFSTAAGDSASAIGDHSTAFGGAFTLANGNYSTVTGYWTTAASMCSSVVGAYNVGGGTSDSWISTDPLFEVGNGTSGSPSDALVVYKNGNAAVQGNFQVGGVVTVAAGGDIPMFSGTN